MGWGVTHHPDTLLLTAMTPSVMNNPPFPAQQMVYIHCIIYLYIFLECECHEHADSCTYNSTLGHGICDSCRHNTTGYQCEKCMDGFYRNASLPTTNPKICIGRS